MTRRKYIQDRELKKVLYYLTKFHNDLEPLSLLKNNCSSAGRSFSEKTISHLFPKGGTQ